MQVNWSSATREVGRVFTVTVIVHNTQIHILLIPYSDQPEMTGVRIATQRAYMTAGTHVFSPFFTLTVCEKVSLNPFHLNVIESITLCDFLYMC